MDKFIKPIDTVFDQKEVVHYFQVFLNSLNPLGLPQYSLKLETATPIILLRNISLLIIIIIVLIILIN